jgi:methionine aminotransferase
VSKGFQSKSPNVGTTIITVMSQFAIDTSAINLSQGFPDFSPPNALLERIKHHFGHGDNQYAPMAGVPALRSSIAEKTAKLYGRNIDAELEITICSGATETGSTETGALAHDAVKIATVTTNDKRSRRMV